MLLFILEDRVGQAKDFLTKYTNSDHDGAFLVFTMQPPGVIAIEANDTAESDSIDDKYLDIDALMNAPFIDNISSIGGNDSKGFDNGVTGNNSKANDHSSDDEVMVVAKFQFKDAYANCPLKQSFQKGTVFWNEVVINHGKFTNLLFTSGDLSGKWLFLLAVVTPGSTDPTLYFLEKKKKNFSDIIEGGKLLLLLLLSLLLPLLLLLLLLFLLLLLL